MQLDAEVKEAEAAGDGRVHVQGFQRDAALFVAAQRAEGLHVVQAVGQFDDKHARVVSGREEHFAEAVGNCRLRRFLFEAVELADAINEAGDFFAKLRRHVGFFQDGVFEDVVQQSRLQHRQVKVLAGEDAADGDGVDEVGFAGLALLSFVRCRAVDGAAQYFFLVFRVEVFFEFVGEFVVRRLQGVGAAEDGEGLVFEGKRRGVHGLFRHDFRVFYFRFNDRYRDFVVQQAGNGGFVFGDFAQGDDRGFVVFGQYQRLVAVGNLSRALGGGEDEAEAVVFVFKAVFDGNAGHVFSVMIRFGLREGDKRAF